MTTALTVVGGLCQASEVASLQVTRTDGPDVRLLGSHPSSARARSWDFSVPQLVIYTRNRDRNTSHQGLGTASACHRACSLWSPMWFFCKRVRLCSLKTLLPTPLAQHPKGCTSFPWLKDEKRQKEREPYDRVGLGKGVRGRVPCARHVHFSLTSGTAGGGCTLHAR